MYIVNRVNTGEARYLRIMNTEYLILREISEL
jgi:hypothetical protein